MERNRQEVGLWWAEYPEQPGLAGPVRPAMSGMTSADALMAQSQPPEKRKVAGSIPALATTFYLH